MQGRKLYGAGSSFARAGRQLERGCPCLRVCLASANTSPPNPHCQVLFQEENLSIDYQYWGPRKQIPHRAQGEGHALRQPQAREVEAQHPEEPADFPEATAVTRRFTKAQGAANEALQKKVTPAPRTPTAPGSSGAGAEGGAPNSLNRPFQFLRQMWEEKRWAGEAWQRRLSWQAQTLREWEGGLEVIQPAHFQHQRPHLSRGLPGAYFSQQGAGRPMRLLDIRVAA